MLQQGCRCHVEAAFALHRFDDDGGHAAGFDVVLEDRLQRIDGVLQAHAVQRIGEAGMEHIAREGAKAGLIGDDLAGQAHGHQGAAMKTARKRNHPGLPVWARAIFTAFSTASAPVVTSSVFLAQSPGALAFRRSASSTYDS